MGESALIRQFLFSTLFSSLPLLREAIAQFLNPSPSCTLARNPFVVITRVVQVPIVFACSLRRSHSAANTRVGKIKEMRENNLRFLSAAQSAAHSKYSHPGRQAGPIGSNDL